MSEFDFSCSYFQKDGISLGEHSQTAHLRELHILYIAQKGHSLCRLALYVRKKGVFYKIKDAYLGITFSITLKFSRTG